MIYECACCGYEAASCSKCKTKNVKIGILDDTFIQMHCMDADCGNIQLLSSIFKESNDLTNTVIH